MASEKRSASWLALGGGSPICRAPGSPNEPEGTRDLLNFRLATLAVIAFRAVYLCATLLCIVNAGLVTASHLVAEHASLARAFLGIGLAVSGVFLLFGGLLHGVQRHVAGLSAEVRRLGPDVAGRMLRHLDRLLAILLVGGVLFCLALGSLTLAIVQRINQGFAVFG